MSAKRDRQIAIARCHRANQNDTKVAQRDRQMQGLLYIGSQVPSLKVQAEHILKNISATPPVWEELNELI